MKPVPIADTQSANSNIEKECKICGRMLPLSEYYQYHRGKYSWYIGQCNDCRRIQQAEKDAKRTDKQHGSATHKERNKRYRDRKGTEGMTNYHRDYRFRKVLRRLHPDSD